MKACKPKIRWQTGRMSVRTGNGKGKRIERHRGRKEENIKTGLESSGMHTLILMRICLRVNNIWWFFSVTWSVFKHSPTRSFFKTHPNVWYTIQCIPLKYTPFKWYNIYIHIWHRSKIANITLHITVIIQMLSLCPQIKPI